MNDDLHCEHAFRLLISVGLDAEAWGIIGWSFIVVFLEIVGMCLLEALTK